MTEALNSAKVISWKCFNVWPFCAYVKFFELFFKFQRRNTSEGHVVRQILGDVYHHLDPAVQQSSCSATTHTSPLPSWLVMPQLPQTWTIPSLFSASPRVSSASTIGGLPVGPSLLPLFSIVPLLLLQGVCAPLAWLLLLFLLTMVACLLLPSRCSTSLRCFVPHDSLLDNMKKVINSCALPVPRFQWISVACTNSTFG